MALNCLLVCFPHIVTVKRPEYTFILLLFSREVNNVTNSGRPCTILLHRLFVMMIVFCFHLYINDKTTLIHNNKIFIIPKYETFVVASLGGVTRRVYLTHIVKKAVTLPVHGPSTSCPPSMHIGVSCYTQRKILCVLFSVCPLSFFFFCFVFLA